MPYKSNWIPSRIDAKTLLIHQSKKLSIPLGKNMVF